MNIQSKQGGANRAEQEGAQLDTSNTIVSKVRRLTVQLIRTILEEVNALGH
jgi:hypothetical protein